MRIFKIKCLDKENAEAGLCHLYDGIIIFQLNTIGMPPHNHDCKCVAKEMDDKEREEFLEKLRDS